MNMKKNILWILAAWLLTMVAVSCSDDDDIDLSASIGPRFENGNVFIGKTKLPNDPVEIGTLPQWLQDEIGKETMFLLLEGTWKGERAYLFDKQWIPRLPQTLLKNSATEAASLRSTKSHAREYPKYRHSPHGFESQQSCGMAVRVIR